MVRIRIGLPATGKNCFGISLPMRRPLPPDNNRWWHVEKGYKYPVVAWKTIAGKDYYFGMDEGYPSNTYYQYDTTTHDRKYRVIENFAAENAYQG